MPAERGVVAPGVRLDRRVQRLADDPAGCAIFGPVRPRWRCALAGYSGKNRIYRASRELGRIFKTEFILSYLSKPELRSRVRKGLLKVEQLHSLSRDVFYGRRGRIKPRELWEQMNSCSSLTLIVACIIYWQAREMSRAIRQGDPEGDGIDISMLKHISPSEWSNVILYGTYKLNRSRIRRPHIEPPGSVQLTL